GVWVHPYRNNAPSGTLFSILCAGNCVGTVFLTFEVARITQVHQDGVVFYVAHFLDLFDNAVTREWSMLLNDLADHIAHNAWLITPFGKCIETATNEYKA